MKMRKFTTFALAAALALGTFGFSVPAKAADNSTDYTITIPATLTVAQSGWNATDGITAQVKSGDTFDSSKKLTVTAESTNSWALKSGDNSVGYNLATATGTYSSSATPASWEFSADELNATSGTNKAMGIIIDDYRSKPAGTYQDTVTFTAAVESAASGNPAPTSASISGYTGGAFAWTGNATTASDFSMNLFNANDAISLLSEKNANVKFTTTAGGASATFSGTATDDSKFCAVYPYTDGLALSGTTITGVKIPTSQWNSDLALEDFKEHSAWDPKAPIAYATTTDGNLQFHNLCAILKFDFPDCGGYFTLTIDANEPLAGTFSLDTTTGELTATAGSKSVTVGDSYRNEITCYGKRHVYVAIAPGTYTGFHVVAQEMDSKEGHRKASATFEAGKIYSMGTFYPNPSTSDQ